MPLDPQTWNKYSYARNNPIAYTDPTGTSFIGKLLSGELFGEGHVGEGVEFNLIPEIPIFPSIGFHGFDGVADQGRDFDDLVKRGRIYAAATPSGQCAPNDNSCEHIRITPGPVPHAPSGASVGRNVKRASKHNFIWWYFKVRNKGNWDYKQFGPHREFEDFGNFNFGATGRAVGIPRVVLRAGAGVAGWIAGTATSGPYMDDSKDQYWIEAGMNFYDYGGYNPCNPMTCSGY